MKRVVLALVLVAAAAGIYRLVQVRSQPPEVPFARAVREKLVSTLSTNGKVEPAESAAARAERAGVVARIAVEKGQRVAAGAVLVELEAREARADLAAAEARLAQFQAEREAILQGGRQREITELTTGAARARLDLETVRRELAAVERLEQKQAATALEVRRLRERADQLELELKSLDEKRTALVAASDRSLADARVREAEAALKLARERVEISLVRAPLGGVVYQFDLKRGDYLNPGDLVALIGRVERVRVKVFVDEPELGRVARGMPVVITWDARPGEQWEGEVEETPAQIIALGSRQVGEVVCLIDNPGAKLLPGTNINAEIRSQVVENALTIPKECLRRENGQTGVYRLEGGRAVWRAVTPGASSITRIQIREGLAAGDAAALPGERLLTSGMAVRARFP
jgi:HlyD family secretion protein